MGETCLTSKSELAYSGFTASHTREKPTVLNLP